MEIVQIFTEEILVTVTVTITHNLFKHELQKNPALPPSCSDYYADLLAGSTAFNGFPVINGHRKPLKTSDRGVPIICKSQYRLPAAKW